jgi:hypothetical protein
MNGCDPVFRKICSKLKPGAMNLVNIVMSYDQYGTQVGLFTNIFIIT